MAKTKTMPEVPAFPSTIYVTLEEDDPDADHFMLAGDNHDDVKAGRRVGIYELREVRTKRITHALN